MLEKRRETLVDFPETMFSVQELDFLYWAVGNPDFAQAIRVTLQSQGVFDNIVCQVVQSASRVAAEMLQETICEFKESF